MAKTGSIRLKAKTIYNFLYKYVWIFLLAISTVVFTLLVFFRGEIGQGKRNSAAFDRCSLILIECKFEVVTGNKSLSIYANGTKPASLHFEVPSSYDVIKQFNFQDYYQANAVSKYTKSVLGFGYVVYRSAPEDHLLGERSTIYICPAWPFVLPIFIWSYMAIKRSNSRRSVIRGFEIRADKVSN